MYQLFAYIKLLQQFTIFKDITIHQNFPCLNVFDTFSNSQIESIRFRMFCLTFFPYSLFVQRTVAFFAFAKIVIITTTARDVKGGTLWIHKFDVALAFLVLQWDCDVALFIAAAVDTEVLFGTHSFVALRYRKICVAYVEWFAIIQSCSGECGCRCGCCTGGCCCC